jgi:Uncharacterized protein conserved in archaea (DUF2180)
MDCYVCATEGIERHAVALCRSCGAGLCMEHLQQTASYLATGAIRTACSHGTWSGPFAARGTAARTLNRRHSPTRGPRLRARAEQGAAASVPAQARASHTPPAA